MLNKRVLVTGASKGIGRSIVSRLVNEGYNVIGTCRNPASISDKIIGVEYITLDLSSDSSIEQCAKEAGSIDILINNAGQSQIGSAEETPTQAYRDMMQINFIGMAYLTSLIIPNMRLKNDGIIVNIGSLIASFPVAYYSSYTSTKAATQAYSYSLSMELSPFNIRVTVVEPHDVKTSISPFLHSKNIDAYAKYVEILQKNVRTSMEHAINPDVIAKRISSILKKKKIAPYYSIGFKSKMLLFGKRFTTQQFVNKNVYKSFGF